MKNLPVWIYILVSLVIAVSANSISAIWAREDDKITLWLLAIVIISPFVFITYGLTTSKLGMTISSGVIDSLLTVSTIAVGLFIFQEWSRISLLQYLGIFCALLGVFLMLFFPKESN
jgi:hypothetical protein